MPAYVIFMREGPVHDPKEMELYRAKSAGTSEGHNMKVLAVYGKLETVEGEGPDKDGIVILEFPTFAEAKAWYNGPYSKAAPHRRNAADYRAFIVEGWIPPGE